MMDDLKAHFIQEMQEVEYDAIKSEYEGQLDHLQSLVVKAIASGSVNDWNDAFIQLANIQQSCLS